uniref:Gustatory receptor n=2 Tax=Lutzomyia longipalpis TaxID=7200 RepID=A0A240SXV2_LUTLO
MLLVKYLKFHLGFLRILGICLQTPNMSRRNKVFAYICSISALLVLPLTGYYVFMSVLPRVASEFLVNFQVLVLFITAFVIVLETLSTKGMQFRFWRFIEKIENLYEEQLSDLEVEYKILSRYQMKKFFLIILYSHGLDFVTIVMTKLFQEEINVVTNWTVIWWFYGSAILITRMRNLSHILVIDTLTMHTHFFNQDLRRLGRILQFSSNSYIVKELNLIKLRHAYLWEAVYWSNKCHRWSQLLNIVDSFYKLTEALYWIYTTREKFPGKAKMGYF